MKTKESIEARLTQVLNDYTIRWTRANELDELQEKGETIDMIERGTLEKELVSYFLLISQLKWVLADETPENNI